MVALYSCSSIQISRVIVLIVVHLRMIVVWTDFHYRQTPLSPSVDLAAAMAWILSIFTTCFPFRAAKIDLGEDQMTEILLRLPPKSIFQYRSVSKQWNSLLTSPEFLSQYSRHFHHRQRTRSPHHLLGFFLRRKWINHYGFSACLMPFLSTQPGRNKFFFHLGSFVASSNGLVLCGGDIHLGSYHILNPVTRKHVSLPQSRKYMDYAHSTGSLPSSIGFSCDEDGDDLTPRYEVVFVYKTSTWDLDNKLCIETYSSETKEWRELVLVATSDFRLSIIYPPFGVNGVLYWWLESNFVAVYDPHNKQGRNKDPNHLQLIQLPGYDRVTRTILKHAPDGGLILGRTFDGLIKIWELSARELGFCRETTITEQEWVLINEVPCDPGLRLVEVISWNPLILIVQQESIVFQYNMETKLMNHIVSLPDERPPNRPFFESISFSSYLLA